MQYRKELLPTAKNPSVLFSLYDCVCKPSKGRLLHTSISNSENMSQF
ncbi:hypothetical protein D051_5100 [Vibrio parahaemolyticus VPCR-2010]|nr:hypothetical protein VIPARAQ4037_A0702 [Vibrio parahaemolyticus AQ4037]EQL84569.1 hypothetical protein D052_0500 [Vibrio parahaemolyticus 10290]EQM03834.1 hypothetical protein D019_1869 [Vibrio parahaemolyticus VP2007-095]EQM11794.1 hypothetical protein D024_5137 [Vibrio parahaemolyticus 3259]EQM44245.1 hypothetical protein D042_4026 [Vibrio parahaemolyticus NIHCB0757]EQM49285.1 hypothetical protein D051_5100 [Vibrio parahaemolyticus VPCR-2010]ESV70320.1 hypothetical protein D021_0599 [Vib